MGDKRKICVVVASRANYGRIKSVLTAVTHHPDLELQLIVGASALLHRFGSAVDIIRRDGFEIDARVYMMLEGENPTTMAKSTGLSIVELATAFENLKPDVVLTVADRFETMGTAIAASYMNIPLAHTQGGEITGSIDESVRHAITKLAHVHFPTTVLSAERLIKMGEDPTTIYQVGCPSMDVLIDLDLSRERLMEVLPTYGGTGKPIDPTQPYLLVMQHPVTTEYGHGRQQIEETIAAVHQSGMQAIWLWPNVDAGSDEVSKGLRVFHENNPDVPVAFYRNFSVEDYAVVLNNAACIIGNSSSGIREGAFLGVPCINIGTRQAGRERGPNVIDVDYSRAEIQRAIQTQTEHGRYDPDHLYGDGCAGQRIADILATAEFKVQKRLTY